LLCNQRFLSFLIIPIDSIDENRDQNSDDGHPIVIRSDEVDLPAVPAEREEMHQVTLHVDKKEIQDEISGDADAKSCFVII
jgi:hypothetical protein